MLPTVRIDDFTSNTVRRCVQKCAYTYVDTTDQRIDVSYGQRVLRDGQQGAGLLFRKAAQYVDVSTALAPLFRYMRWHGSRTPNEVYRLSIDPTSVERMKLFPPTGPPVTGRDALCGSVAGPWDRLTLSVRNHYLYQSIESYLNGLSWTETQIYDHPKYAGDPERARRRCEKIEKLIESMRAQGYQQQLDEKTATSPDEWIRDVYIGDQIVVGLDRSGRPIHLKNGRHRLVVAQLLDIERIPVVVSMYHSKTSIPADASLIRSD